jgi:hypothetical protein
MNPHVARALGKRTADRLVEAAKIPTTMQHDGAAEWTLAYDGALYIVITEVDGRLPVRLVRIPKKCSPNHILAAKQDVNAALLWATRQIFGITIS